MIRAFSRITIVPGVGLAIGPRSAFGPALLLSNAEVWPPFSCVTSFPCVGAGGTVCALATPEHPEGHGGDSCASQ